MEIKILGPGCASCKRLYAEAEKAIARVGQPATITKVEAIEDIMAYGILRTPGLVIDEGGGFGPDPRRVGDRDHDHDRPGKGVGKRVQS